jgi:hypothetical protein
MYVELALVLWVVVNTTLGVYFGLHLTSDFDGFYFAAQAFRQGLDPYTQGRETLAWANTNPPLFLWLLQPLTFLPVQQAEAAWMIVGMLCLLVSIACVARALNRRTSLLILLVLVPHTVSLNLYLGQVGLLLMPLMTAAWLADRRARWAASAACLGVAMAWKPFLGLYAIDLARRRQWRALAVWGGAGALIAGCSVIVGGFDQTQAWLTSMVSVDRLSGYVGNGSWRGWTRRLFFEDAISATPTETALVETSALEYTVWLAGVVMLLAVTASCLRRREVDARWSVLGLVTLLVSPLGWVYYLAVWTGPLVATLRTSPLTLAGLGLLSVPVTPLAGSGILDDRPVLVLTLGSAAFWGILCLWIAACRASDRVAQSATVSRSPAQNHMDGVRTVRS